jgi:molybdopterin converting factor small subunit
MPATKRLHLQFFASLREEAGRAALDLDTAARTPADLYRELQQSHGLRLPLSAVRVAVNARYVSLDSELQPDDHVVYIPPVAGG